MGQTQSTGNNDMIVLGQGSYNCAHRITIQKNGKKEVAVLRVALVSKTNDAKQETVLFRYLQELKSLKRKDLEYMIQRIEDELFEIQRGGRVRVLVMRGLQIVDVFQPFEAVLGPSLLKTWAPSALYTTYEFSQLYNQQEMGKLCMTVREGLGYGNIYDVGVQYLEYLEGGNYGYTEERHDYNKDKFDLFSLLWFLNVAQKKFDFRHHDLKDTNIMIRTYKEEQNFTFYIGDDIEYHFKSNRVPVIIDYDFATLYTSVRKSHRESIGTYIWAPPEMLSIELAKKTRGYSSKSITKDGYDWWCIGCVFLNRFVNLYNYIENSRYSALLYAEQTLSMFPEYAKEREMSKSILQALFFSFSIASLFNNTTTPFVLEMTQAPAWNIFLRGSIYNNFKDSILNNTDIRPFMNILKQLLHWNPERRIFDYLYNEPLFQPNQRPERGILRNEQVFSMDKTTSDKEEISLKEFPYLMARISCAACLKDSPKHVCSCCGISMCDKKCQRDFH